MRWKLAVGILISVVCLSIALKGISLQEIGLALRQADPRWILGTVGMIALAFTCRAIRWSWILQTVKPASPRELFAPLMLGFFANNILPFRMGELVRAHAAGQKLHLSRVTALATIVTERLLDTLSFLVIFLIVASLFPFPPAIDRAVTIMAAGGVAATVFLFLGIRYETHFYALLARAGLPASWRSRVEEFARRFTHGLGGLRAGRSLVMALLWSAGVWLAEGGSMYFLCNAFPAGITFLQAYVVLFFIGLGVALPQAPGYVGTLELFGSMALGLMGIPKEMALPTMLALHGVQFAFVGILGLWALWSEGLKWSQLVAKVADEQKEPHKIASK